MDRGETLQAWQDLLSNPAWKVYQELLHQYKREAFQALRNKCKTEGLVNGYYAGYWDGMHKAMEIPKDQIENLKKEG